MCLKTLQWLPVPFRMKSKILRCNPQGPASDLCMHSQLDGKPFSSSPQASSCRPFTSLNMIKYFPPLDFAHAVQSLPFALLTSFYLPLAFQLLTDFLRKTFLHCRPGVIRSHCTLSFSLIVFFLPWHTYI